MPPKDFTSNTPHILAVWYEFKRAPWPLTSIGQAIEYGYELDGSVSAAPSSAASGHGGAPVIGNGSNGANGKTHVKGGKAKRRSRPNVKVDIVCQGGDEWVKVNTYVGRRVPRCSCRVLAAQEG